MGGGTYSVSRAKTRSQIQNYSGKSTKEVFRNEDIDNAMNPKGIKIRESRDSDEHPESVAIIMGLDVTGSMGYIPKHLITEGLTTTMGTIIERGVEHPQVLFVGIGDHKVDRAPLQVAQFESSDPLLDKWLKDVFLEGGGGGNGGESYPLAWYFAANHTSIDCFEKRNQKGILITIGDEPAHNLIPRKAIKDLMGNTASVEQNEVTAGQLLEDARKLYHVRHLHLTETRTGDRPEVKGSWKELMGDDAIFVEDHEEIPKIMANLTLELTGSVKTPVAETVTESDESEQQSNEDEVVL